MKLVVLALTSLFTLVSTLKAEDIKVATYNVEHFAQRFDSNEFRKWATTQPNAAELKPYVNEEKKQDDKDLWETAMVIADEHFSPDIIVIEECCDQAQLRHFNKRWLRGLYETVIVFPSNSERVQYLGMMLK